MELNALLFPAPNITYTPEELEGDIMYIPRHYEFNKMHRAALKDLDKLNHSNTMDARQSHRSADFKAAFGTSSQEETKQRHHGSRRKLEDFCGTPSSNHGFGISDKKQSESFN